jgi:phosphoribosylanthranilate isomerase
MRVKFCGVTRIEDAREAVRLGAWAIGLNHWPQSGRYCEPAVAAQISAELRRQTLVTGVFVNATLDEVARAVEDESLAMVQLHGDEGPDFCRAVAARTGAKVIKAIRVRSTAEIQAAQAYRTDFHLFDAHRPGRPGGTGETFDWELIRDRPSEIPAILAGGLKPDNVAAAIDVVHPYAVDVSSGVESAPGIKDPRLMTAFAREAGVREALAT